MHTNRLFELNRYGGLRYYKAPVKEQKYAEYRLRQKNAKIPSFE